MQIVADMQSCGCAAIQNQCNAIESMGRVPERPMRQQLSNFKAEFFKALAHPLRISILDALREGELTVNEISQRFDVEPANASQHLAVLRTRTILIAPNDRPNPYYSVPITSTS